MLVATALLYSNALQAFDFQPALQKEEIDALVVGLDACIKRYGAGFEHWPAVMLATALVMPVTLRLPDYIERRKKLPTHEQIVKEHEKESSHGN